MTESNPLELEAQADELEAEAMLLRAKAKRIKLATKTVQATQASSPESHLTRAEYARRSSVSEATIARLLKEGLPSIPVGSTVRIDPVAADAWRQMRGRKPTRSAPTKETDVDVDDVLATAGLRLVATGGHR